MYGGGGGSGGGVARTSVAESAEQESKLQDKRAKQEIRDEKFPIYFPSLAVYGFAAGRGAAVLRFIDGISPFHNTHSKVQQVNPYLPLLPVPRRWR